MVYQFMRDAITHPFFNIAVGAGGTWFFAWFYYKRAGDDSITQSCRAHHGVAA